MAVATTAGATRPASVRTKRALLALSHAIEQELLTTDDLPLESDALVFGLFQHRHYFDVERDRYADLAARGATCIVGFAGSADDMPAGVHAVTFEADNPFAREWVLVTIDGQEGAALVARDLHDAPHDDPDTEAGRLFSARWTFSPRSAASEAARLMRVFGHQLPTDVVQQAEQAIEKARAVERSPNEERMTAAAEALTSRFDR
jgi:DICT domain-containing protein